MSGEKRENCEQIRGHSPFASGADGKDGEKMPEKKLFRKNYMLSVIFPCGDPLAIFCKVGYIFIARNVLIKEKEFEA